MKRIKVLLFSLILIFSMIACGKATDADWQEQYDLGMRYLTEGNYEDAVLAFTMAIEIDPKMPEAYIGRGDAYVMWGESENDVLIEKNEFALVDYLDAIKLDGKLADTYLKVANVYMTLGDPGSALEILEKGYKKTKDKRLADMLEDIEMSPVYGALQDPDFIPFKDFTDEERKILSAMIVNMENGNPEPVCVELESGFLDKLIMKYWQKDNGWSIYPTVFSVYNGYYIEMNVFDDYPRIIICPQNGMAYECSIEVFEDSKDYRYNLFEQKDGEHNNGDYYEMHETTWYEDGTVSRYVDINGVASFE